MSKTILQCIEEGDEEALRRLLLQGLDSIRGSGFDEGTPLTYAVQCKKIGIVRLLLVAGSDPNARFGAPLISAAKNGSIDIANLLWKAGACIDIMDDAPYRVATQNDRTEFISWIESKRRD